MAQQDDGAQAAPAATVSHAVAPGDEGRHEPAADRLWNESWYMDFVAEHGLVAGYVRLGLYPNMGVTWWTAMVVGLDRPTVASVVYDLPVAQGRGPDGVSVVGGDLDASIGYDDPLRTFWVRGRAPAAYYVDPRAIYRGETGAASAIGWDLTWRTDGEPYHYVATTRYEVPCLVSGELTVGDERFTLAGHGQRDHSWGVRDWWMFGWCWSAVRLDDGTRVHVAHIRLPGSPVTFGYVQRPGQPVIPLSAGDVTEDLGTEGLPTNGRIVVAGAGLDLAVEPLAFGPLLLTDGETGRVSRFPRALARFTGDDGRSGLGWIEWNQPRTP